MGRKKKPVPDDPEQSARFKEVAERILDDDAEEKLEEAIRNILSKKKDKQLGE